MVILYSCSTDEITQYEKCSDSVLNGCIEIQNDWLMKLNGKYEVTEGSELLGSYVILKAVGNKITIVAEKDYSLFKLNVGQKESNLYAEGTCMSMGREYKYAKFICESNSGFSYISGNNHCDSIISLSGYIGYSCTGTLNHIQLKLIKPIDYNNSRFYIIAHRGGGSQGTCFSETENSLKIINEAQYHFADAVEIDVRLTKDNIPIVYHDKTFNPRVINSEFVLGKVSDFYFEHVRRFARLKNGEPVPSLEESLNCILNDINIRMVWIDFKTPQAVPYSLPIIKKFNDIAESKGKKLIIYAGLPDDEIAQSYYNSGGNDLCQAICETDSEIANKCNPSFIGKRYTTGTMPEYIDNKHSEGIGVLFWTIDDPTFAKQLIYEGKADGAITNYPQMLAYEYFSQL